MGAFSGLLQRQRAGAKGVEEKPAAVPPPKVVTLPLAGYADTWPDKPKTPVEIGIRLVGTTDIDDARAEAARLAWQSHVQDADDEVRNEAYNDALMRGIVARATCKPTDVTDPFWDCADDNVKLALSPLGVRFLWEAAEELKIQLDPLSDDADDAELAELAALLQSGEPWGRLDYAAARRVRRLLAHALEALR